MQETLGEEGSTPVSGRTPGGGHGNPLQYSYLEDSTDRGAWRAPVHGVAESQTPLKRLSMQHAWKITWANEVKGCQGWRKLSERAELMTDFP